MSVLQFNSLLLSGLAGMALEEDESTGLGNHSQCFLMTPPSSLRP